jgi:hypothetical protein
MATWIKTVQPQRGTDHVELRYFWGVRIFLSHVVQCSPLSRRQVFPSVKQKSRNFTRQHKTLETMLVYRNSKLCPATAVQNGF